MLLISCAGISTYYRYFFCSILNPFLFLYLLEICNKFSVISASQWTATKIKELHKRGCQVMSGLHVIIKPIANQMPQMSILSRASGNECNLFRVSSSASWISPWKMFTCIIAHVRGTQFAVIEALANYISVIMCVLYVCPGKPEEPEYASNCFSPGGGSTRKDGPSSIVIISS